MCVFCNFELWVFISCGFIHYLLCRIGHLDTLMMFTNTISVSNIYFTSSVVIVPIIWLCMTVVVVVISFSIIMYRRRRS